MESKKCFKCGETKPLADFYKHPRMADGHVNKCKECNKIDVQINYRKRLDKKKEYERKREQDPERRKKKSIYAKRIRENNPEKKKAWNLFSNAIRDGRVIKQPCVICGTMENVQGHHTDYSKPLDVIWYCFKHHREVGHNQTAAIDAENMKNDQSN